MAIRLAPKNTKLRRSTSAMVLGNIALLLTVRAQKLRLDFHFVVSRVLVQATAYTALILITEPAIPKNISKRVDTITLGMNGRKKSPVFGPRSAKPFTTSEATANATGIISNIDTSIFGEIPKMRSDLLCAAIGSSRLFAIGNVMLPTRLNSTVRVPPCLRLLFAIDIVSAEFIAHGGE